MRYSDIFSKIKGEKSTLPMEDYMHVKNIKSALFYSRVKKIYYAVPFLEKQKVKGICWFASPTYIVVLCIVVGCRRYLVEPLLLYQAKYSLHKAVVTSEQ
jgi:hypothetical protein